MYIVVTLVKELQVKDAGLELVNRHMQCVLSECQQSVTVLRKELLRVHAKREDNSLQ